MKKQGISNEITEKLDLPQELITGIHRLVITGGRSLLLENHRGIRGFSSKEIRVDVKDGIIVVCGSDLMLPILTKSTLEVTGKIETVALVEE